MFPVKLAMAPKIAVIAPTATKMYTRYLPAVTFNSINRKQNTAIKSETSPIFNINLADIMLRIKSLLPLNSFLITTHIKF